jgi:hypothetical protein
VDLSIPCRLGTPAYILQAKTRGNVCVHMLPRAITVLEPASLLREGSDNATCPRLRTPPLRLGGLQRCHVPRGFGPPHHSGGIRCCHASLSTGPCLAAEEGSGTDTRPSALDHTTSVVGSDADTCPMALHRPWAVEGGLAATACSDARVFLRHAHALPMHLQDVWADDVIMTCKSCGQALQHHAIVHHYADNH